VIEPRAQAILNFWFGPDPLGPNQLSQKLCLWFGGEDPPEVIELRDETIANRFGPLAGSAARGELDSWSGSPHRLLALILLLDQFPRHIHRGRALAYAQDARAVALTVQGLQTGADAALTPAQRLFFYMPLQHAESLQLQEESIAAFRRLAADAPATQRELFEGCLAFARQHQEVIARFGRFPHRNAALHRRNTSEESRYLNAEG
jgi:uncharacterized protein (DUF924 family)